MAASPGTLSELLPAAAQLQLLDVIHSDSDVVLVVSLRRMSAECPQCGTVSPHVHSRYRRWLRDLPWQGSRVRIQLLTKRFYCRARHCQCRVFAQRLPGLAPAYSRQTSRYGEALLAIGYALGGEAGHRLAQRLGFASSADTILRTVARSNCLDLCNNVRVLGVDDWAWRRGHRYGTVLVDLERHRPIDLLPNRQAETLADWLRLHPTVEVISRDRAGAYAEAARKGAPAAQQVADRFHLMCNLTQALQRVLERLVHVLQRIDPLSRTDSEEPLAPNFSEPAADGIIEAGASPNQHERQREERRDKRRGLFDAVHEAFAQGLTKRAIARQFGINRATVRKFLRSTEFPERAPRQRRSGLDAYRSYLEQRWNEGCHNASQLCRELRDLGYGGQRSRVKEYLQAWRAETARTTPVRARKLPNLRLVALWLTKYADDRTADEQQWVQTIASAHPQIATAQALAQQFRDVFKKHDAAALDTWITSATSAQIPEVNRFVAGLVHDYAAVAAAVEQEWSNGQVEGQIHRLKLLKRQMYGRSGFQLLRRRVLPFGCDRQRFSP